MAYVKCPVCGLTFNREKEETVYINRRYYHLDCCTENQIYRERIFTLLNELWDKCSRVKIDAQIAEINQKEHISTKQIYDDLYYFFKILKNDSTKYQNTIKIVPYIHAEAQRYYYSLQKENNRKKEIEENLEDLNLMDIKVIYGNKMPKKPKEYLKTKTEEGKNNDLKNT